MNLLELMLVISIAVIIGASNFSNTGLEKGKGLAARSQANMMMIGTKVQQLCDDTQRQCTGLANGNVALPATYLPTAPIDPSATAAANQYTMTLNTVAADGSKCFTVEGANSYIHDALLNVPLAGGGYPAENAGGAAGFLHYDSRTGTVYQTATNTSPVAAGC